MQLWIYEAISSAGTHFVVCNNARLPRMLRWKSTKKNIRIRDIYKHIFDLKSVRNLLAFIYCMVVTFVSVSKLEIIVSVLCSPSWM